MARLQTLASRLSGLPQRQGSVQASRTDESARFYQTPEWRQLATACKRRDGYRCTDPTCLTPGRGYGGRLIADHIIPRREGGSDDLSNLQTLCPTCDNRKHSEKGRG